MISYCPSSLHALGFHHLFTRVCTPLVISVRQQKFENRRTYRITCESNPAYEWRTLANGTGLDKDIVEDDDDDSESRECLWTC